MSRSRIIPAIAAAAALAGAVAAATHARAATEDARPVVLANGWQISPVGSHVGLPGDLPVGLLPSDDGRFLFVSTAGYHDHGVDVVDAAAGRVVASLPLKNTWIGAAVDEQRETLYLSGAQGEGPEGGAILRVRWHDGVLSRLPDVAIADAAPHGRRYVGGIAVGRDGALYAADTMNDRVYRLNPADARVAASAAVGYRPYGLAVSPDGTTVAASNWGDASVSLLDATTLRERARVHVGLHPNALRYASDGRLFVADGASDAVSVVAGDAVAETISTSAAPSGPIGAVPVALAIAPDARRLYVANAGNNDVAVVDISAPGRARLSGFVPTGWYPSALALSPDGGRLFVGVGRGFGTAANFPARLPEHAHVAQPFAGGKSVERARTPIRYDYIADALAGAVSMLAVPSGEELARDTAIVRRNLAHREASVSRENAAAVRTAAFARIKHVVYVIKENRTYDQVLGDLGKGNGDPRLAMFGGPITPNAHAIAREFADLDNVYTNGEVSEDGHEWCDAAYSSDFTDLVWPNQYSGLGQPEADQRLIASPAGYLWENAGRHGRSYVDYGETPWFETSPQTPDPWKLPSLVGHVSLDWRDSEARDPVNVQRYFVRDLRRAEASGSWPSLVVMHLWDDHTFGLKAGALSPRAMVASNDLALGMVVDAVSHSRFWPETAIFVIEDDAQDGPDHVDAHRTVGFAVSPYVRRGIVDGTHYTQASIVRTIELILGLPAMTQYDAAATPLYRSFGTRPDVRPYRLRPAEVSLSERNPASGEGARISARLDFSRPDRADPAVLNALLWRAMKPGVPMPRPAQRPEHDR